MGNSSHQPLGEGSGNQGNVELSGLETNSHSGNGGAVESDAATTPLPCGKPRPPIERTGTPTKELTLQTWLLRSHFQQNRIHWRQCHEYYVTHEPTVAQLDQEHRFKPADIDRAFATVKFPSSSGSVLQVIQGIRDFEGQLVRAMKGVSQACVLYAKLLLHGVHVDLELLKIICQTSMEQVEAVIRHRKWLKKGICKFLRIFRPRHLTEHIH